MNNNPFYKTRIQAHIVKLEITQTTKCIVKSQPNYRVRRLTGKD